VRGVQHGPPPGTRSAVTPAVAARRSAGLLEAGLLGAGLLGTGLLGTGLLEADILSAGLLSAGLLGASPGPVLAVPGGLPCPGEAAAGSGRVAPRR